MSHNFPLESCFQTRGLLSHEPRLSWAIDAVARACELTRGLQDSLGLAQQTKSDLSPVTVADYAVQALISHDLGLAQPLLELVAEEDDALLVGSSGMLEAISQVLTGWMPDVSHKLLRQLLQRSHRSGQGFWTLDPIDGTKGFLRGANYAIALAWIENGEPVLGVLGCPRLKLSSFSPPGVLVASRRGAGAWARPLDRHQAWRRLTCSTETRLSKARLLHSFEPNHTDLDEIARLRCRLHLEDPGLGIDSQAKYVMLAAGDGELMVRLLNPSQPDYQERIWDHAAGQVILEEAGGIVSDLKGYPLDYSRGRTLAANQGVLACSSQSLHQKALQALACV
jgi:3'(2'), 5'-bisphosphate nucleotidase